MHYVLSPPATKSNKGMYTSGIPASVHGPKKRVGPYGGPQPPGSHPPLTQDAAHSKKKHAGSEGDHRKREVLYKEELWYRQIQEDGCKKGAENRGIME